MKKKRIYHYVGKDTIEIINDNYGYAVIKENDRIQFFPSYTPDKKEIYTIIITNSVEKKVLEINEDIAKRINTHSVSQLFNINPKETYKISPIYHMYERITEFKNKVIKEVNQYNDFFTTNYFEVKKLIDPAIEILIGIDVERTKLLTEKEIKIEGYLNTSIQSPISTNKTEYLSHYIDEINQYAKKTLTEINECKGKEVGLMKMKLQDMIDVIEVGFYLEEFQYDLAAQKAQNLDTAVREGFSKDFWTNFVCLSKDELNELEKKAIMKDKLESDLSNKNHHHQKKI